MEAKSHKSTSNTDRSIQGWERLVGFLVGFFTLVNFQFPPGLDQGIRFTDYLGAFTWVYVIFHLLRHQSVPKRPLFRAFLLFGMVVPWLLLSTITPRTIIDPLRWSLLIAATGTLFWFLRSSARRFVLQGIVWGGAAQLAVVLLQFLGLFQLTVTLGLTAPDSDFTNTFLGRWRPPGMYGTNATPAVAALAIPAAIGLVDEGRGKGRWIILAVTVALATCVATLTRSTVLVIAVLMIVWGGTKLKDVKRVGAAVVVVVTTVVIVANFGPPGGWQRWENASLESGNASARIESTIGSLKLSISEPLGLGRDQYSHELQSQFGKSRTHNAFTYLALAANLPLAITMFVYLLGRGMAVLRNRSFESWLAVTMFGLCFWEEYFRNPVFIMMGILVILSGVYQRPRV